MSEIEKKSELVSLQIEKAILTGEFTPGVRLPPEREMAQRYGVSRSILRESVKQLASLGLVRTEAQSGTYVTDYSREASLEFLVYLLDNNESLDPDIFRSLLEFRDMLECTAAHGAAERSDASFVSLMEKRLEVLKLCGNDPATLAQRDYEFHSAVIDRTGNIAFRLLFNACRPVYLFYAEEFYRFPGHLETTLGQLTALIEAFRRREGEKAAEVMASALAFGRERIFESLAIKTTTEVI